MSKDRRITYRTARTASALGVLAVVFLVVVLPAPVSAAHRVGASRCKPGRSDLLAIDVQAQVFEVTDYNGFREIFGCAYGGRSFFVGFPAENELSPGGGGGVELVTLAGSVVAYQHSRFGEVGWASWTILVRNIRTGGWDHRVSTGVLEEPNPNPDSAGIGPALSIVAKSDGSVAWIAEDRFLSEKKPAYYQVHTVDKTGGHVVGLGTDIQPKSLALSGSTLYWTQGGRAMSAMLE